MDRTLTANTRIFDGSGAEPFPGDVLVEGPRIAAVGRGGGLRREGARVIDGAGATLMPGLIEPHGHASYPDVSVERMRKRGMKDGRLRKAPPAA